MCVYDHHVYFTQTRIYLGFLELLVHHDLLFHL